MLTNKERLVADATFQIRSARMCWLHKTRYSNLKWCPCPCSCCLYLQYFLHYPPWQCVADMHRLTLALGLSLDPSIPRLVLLALHCTALHCFARLVATACTIALTVSKSEFQKNLSTSCSSLFASPCHAMPSYLTRLASRALDCCTIAAHFAKAQIVITSTSSVFPSCRIAVGRQSK
jgi:hypothetical protein